MFLGKLPTYPSPNLSFSPKREVSVTVRFGEGKVGSFPETYIGPKVIYSLSALLTEITWRIEDWNSPVIFVVRTLTYAVLPCWSKNEFKTYFVSNL